MNSLTAIQKTFRVFKVLAKAAMILSFIWAGLAVLGLLCGAVWYSGGTVIGADQELLLYLTTADSLNQMIGTLLTETALALTDGILFLFAFRYFRQEQADGTPFTQSGAEQIMRLGTRTIVLPLVAAILSAVFCKFFDVTEPPDWSNLPSLTMGIVLILASLVFRYGAELEKRCSEAGTEPRE